MPRRVAHQRLPSAGPAREALREKGQFWTPDWVAEAMVGYVLQGETDHVFDPAVGEGAFFRATKSVAGKTGRRVSLLGTEVDPAAMEQAMAHGLDREDLASVQMRDFVLDPPAGSFRAIVANPPYIRHHRLSAETKAQLRTYCTQVIGETLDGRAGLHIYFLIRALQLLEPGGRLAFIVPADTCEGKFAPRLWSWITRHYRLDAVVTFMPEATPFPRVDTNPIVLLIRREAPVSHLLWAQCMAPHTDTLKRWTLSGCETHVGDDLLVEARELTEALATGLSRRKGTTADDEDVPLSNFATVLRGIASGDNDFFFLTKSRAMQLGIPPAFLRVAIGRTRDVEGDEITCDTITRMEEAGRPTLLFALDGRPKSALPLAVQEYLRRGETANVHKRPLISTRNPWYKMETRAVPPILFAYLGRRHARFIRNYAGALPLTGFLCVYPKRDDAAFVNALWQVLQDPATIANLARVGKSYGDGAIKVEPSALRALPLSLRVVRAAGLLQHACLAQVPLF